MKKALSLVIFESIDLYTGANFDDMLQIDISHLTESCVNFVFSQYQMLSVLEVKEAFLMFASGKLKADLTTYNGKFKVKHLGNLLSSYLVFRKNVIHEYEKKNDWICQQSEDDKKNEKNEQTKSDVISDYLLILERFKQEPNVLMLEREIKPFWGKILAFEGFVDFDLEQKKEILFEAKLIVSSEMRAEYEAARLKKDDISAQKVTSIASFIDSKGSESTFESRVEMKYGKLIVIKSILKSIESLD